MRTDSTRRTLDEMQAHLFDELNRLADPDLSAEDLDAEIRRAGAMVGISREIINAGQLQVTAERVYAEASARGRRPRLLSAPDGSH